MLQVWWLHSEWSLYRRIRANMARAVASFCALLLLAVSVKCLTDRTLPAIFFSFGKDVGDRVLRAGDDVSSPAIRIPTARFEFFNVTRNTVYVSLSRYKLVLLLLFCMFVILTNSFFLRTYTIIQSLTNNALTHFSWSQRSTHSDTTPWPW